MKRTFRLFLLSLCASFLLVGCDDFFPGIDPGNGPGTDPENGNDSAAVAISNRDRVYTADQSSNTVSVIDPSTNKLLGVIRLGKARPDVFSPLYNREANVHGMGVSPDGKTLGVVATLTNTVVFIDPATNTVKGKVYVDRNPHEGFFTPDGKEYWVAVRGEDYVSVIDMEKMQVVDRIQTAKGPSMVVFRPDGKVAFVNHSFSAELDVVDVQTHQVIKRVPVVSPFSPNLTVTADGKQVWLTHKDVGKVSVVNAQTYEVEGVIDSGPVTNHVNFGGEGGGTRYSGASAGDYAYVSIGGENVVKAYNRQRQLVATIPVGPTPHGVWPSGDGTRMYIGLEDGDAVAVIDTKTNKKIAEIPMGQAPQAILYVVNAAPDGGAPNLEDYQPTRPVNVRLTPGGAQPVPGEGGGVTVRHVAGVDEVILGARKLASNTTYTLYLSDQKDALANEDAVLTVKTDEMGTGNAQAYTLLKMQLDQKHLLLLKGDKDPDGEIVLQEPI